MQFHANIQSQSQAAQRFGETNTGILFSEAKCALRK